VHRKFEKRIALVVSEIIASEVLDGVVNLNLEEGKIVGGREWYHSKERW